MKEINWTKVGAIAGIVAAVAAVIIIPITYFGNREKHNEAVQSNSNEISTISIKTMEKQEVDTTKILNTNKVFGVISIRPFDEITTFVVFQLIGSDSVQNVNVRVSEYGICRIQNEYYFPIDEMYRNELFEIELVRKEFNNVGNVRISIDWYESGEHHREIKAVDIIERKEIETD